MRVRFLKKMREKRKRKGMRERKGERKREREKSSSCQLSEETVQANREEGEPERRLDALFGWEKKSERRVRADLRLVLLVSWIHQYTLLVNRIEGHARLK